MKRKLTAIALSLALVLTMIPLTAMAGDGDVDGRGCTSFYFGKDLTANGACIWGRTEDVGANYAKLFNVEQAATYTIDPVRFDNYDGNWQAYEGDLYVAGSWNATQTTFTPRFRWPYPAKTLRFTYNRDSIFNEWNDPFPYAEVGINEKGVGISATESLSSMKSQVTSLDPAVSRNSGGLTEVDITAVVLMQAETARGACELVAKIIDTVGAGGREGLFLSDPNEVWYFQWLTGHQYVAAKCPDDMIGFSPNITGNVGPNGVVDITDTENFICSPKLVDIAVQAGVYVGDPKDPGNLNKIKVCDSYGSTTNHQTGRMRTGWGQIYGYTKDAEISANVPGNVYMNFFLDPPAGRKYSLYEIMRFFAGRGEGTDWEAASSIAAAGTVEAHVYELRPDMPSELATVMWMTMAPPEFGVFIPYYANLVTDAFDKMYSPDVGRNSPTGPTGYNAADPDNNSVYWVFRQLHTECNLTNLAERARIGNGVRAFWEDYQKSLIEQQAYIDMYMLRLLKDQGREAVEKAATEFSMYLSEESYEYAKKILAELRAFKAAGTAGNFVPSFSALPSYTPETTVFVSLSAADVSYIGGDAAYTLSLAGATDVLTVELEFEIDGSMLAGKALAGANGFDPINNILWVNTSGNTWKGETTLTYEAGDSTGFTGDADIATFVYTPKGFGNAAMSLTGAKVTGLYGGTTTYLDAVIKGGKAKTTVAYNKYDLNRDGKVDALDLGIVLLYCGFKASDPEWKSFVKVNDAWGNPLTAKVADVNENGVVDMLDLIDVFINYTK
ncbi:MAG: C69 family dipeptidase [Clostridiales bacterium]|nr:C69 family dipeptidase [Clostridiales bacterium]